jgi:hypothetical protein
MAETTTAADNHYKGGNTIMERHNYHDDPPPPGFGWHRTWLSRIADERGTELPPQVVRWFATAAQASDAAHDLREWADEHRDVLDASDRWDIASVVHQLDGQAMVLDEAERWRDSARERDRISSPDSSTPWQSAEEMAAGSDVLTLMRRRAQLDEWRDRGMADPRTLTDYAAELDAATSVAYARRETVGQSSTPTPAEGLNTHVLAFNRHLVEQAESEGIHPARAAQRAATTAEVEWRTEAEALDFDTDSAAEFAFNAAATVFVLGDTDHAWRLNEVRQAVREAATSEARIEAANEVRTLLQAARMREAERQARQPTAAQVALAEQQAQRRAEGGPQPAQLAGSVATPENLAKIAAAQAAARERLAQLDSAADRAERRAAALELARAEREQRTSAGGKAVRR